MLYAITSDLFCKRLSKIHRAREPVPSTCPVTSAPTGPLVRVLAASRVLARLPRHASGSESSRPAQAAQVTVLYA